MCGIVYSANFTGAPVNKYILKRYEEQKNRGQDGFGFYIPKTNQLTHNTRESRIRNLLKRTDATEVLFHHRFPTSTMNVRNGCHPYSTKDTFKNNYVGVHNGVLNNEDELLKEQKKLGIEYVSKMKDGSFNDSEALVYDIASVIEGEKKSLTASGTIAFILIERNSKGVPINIHFGRNYGNPLKMIRNQHQFTLASEGDGTDVTPHTLHTYNYATGKITKKPMHIPSYVYPTYPTYNYKTSEYDYEEEWYDDEFEKTDSGVWTLKPEASIKTIEEYSNDFDDMYSPLPTWTIDGDGATEGALEYLSDTLGAHSEAINWARYDWKQMQKEVDRLERLELHYNGLSDFQNKKLDTLYELSEVFKGIVALLVEDEELMVNACKNWGSDIGGLTNE